MSRSSAACYPEQGPLTIDRGVVSLLSGLLPWAGAFDRLDRGVTNPYVVTLLFIFQGDEKLESGSEEDAGEEEGSSSEEDDNPDDEYEGESDLEAEDKSQRDYLKNLDKEDPEFYKFLQEEGDDALINPQEDDSSRSEDNDSRSGHHLTNLFYLFAFLLVFYSLVYQTSNEWPLRTKHSLNLPIVLFRSTSSHRTTLPVKRL